MNIALLTCSTGGGHNAAASALAQELSRRGHESHIYDALEFLPKSAAELISRGHDFAYRYTPKLYGMGYRKEEKHPSPLLYDNSIRGIGPLHEALLRDSIDAVLCVHLFPAMMMTELRCNYALRLPCWFVATDFTCSPGVGSLRLDGVCIPHPALVEEFEAAGAGPIYATGIPVRREFCVPPDKAGAREALGLADRERVLTLACGSMGAGPLRATAADIAELLGEKGTLVAVCGSNQRLFEQLRDDFVNEPRGAGAGLYTADVPVYAGLRPADLQGRRPDHGGGRGLRNAPSVPGRGAGLREPEPAVHDQPGLRPGRGGGGVHRAPAAGLLQRLHRPHRHAAAAHGQLPRGCSLRNL